MTGSFCAGIPSDMVKFQADQPRRMR